MNKITKPLLGICLLFIAGCNTNKKEELFDEFSNTPKITEISQTNFLLSLNQEIDLTKNQFYCSSLGYGWDEVRKRFNNNIQINKEFEALRLLNADVNFKSSLADTVIKTTIAIKGNETTIKAKFNLALPFAFQKYERFDAHEFLTDDSIETLSFQERSGLLEKYHTTFNDETVVTFGPPVESTESDALESIDLLYYKSNKEFAIRMKPANNDHEIILFMPETPNFKTLKDALNSYKNKENIFLARKHKYNEIITSEYGLKLDEELKINNFTEKEIIDLHLKDGDHFSVPILSMGLTKTFNKLKGNIFNETEKIVECKQLINLDFNEKGALIESEASVISVSIGLIPYPKKLHFNKPFLIIFKRKDTDNPYLLGWIANTSIMETRDKLTTNNEVN